MPAPYGYCPTCKHPGKTRERRPDGNDTCESGHVYPSKLALGFVDVVMDEIMGDDSPQDPGDWLSEEKIREHINAGGTLLNHEQAKVLLDEIDRLRKSREHHRQTALDISEDNDELQKQIEEQNQRMQDLLQKAERLEKLVPPELERGPGFVGQGNWSVFAEKVVEERDRALDEVKRLGAEIAAKKEHANVHFNKKWEFVGVDGYGPFSLKQVDKDRWEIQLLHEKITLYNKKGHRVRSNHNHDGDGDW